MKEAKYCNSNRWLTTLLVNEKILKVSRKQIVEILEKENIGEVIALLLNKEDDNWYGIAKIKLSQLYLFEENNKLECDFCNSKIKINFPSYMLPLPRKI